MGKGLSMHGPGAFTPTVNPGGFALASFTPPAGFKITAVSANRFVIAGAQGLTEAAVYTSAGRVLGADPQPWTTDKDVASEPITFDAAALGDDGAAGLEWGIKCPAILPPSRTECDGGAFALSGTITISDGVPDPTPQPTPLPTTPQPTATPTPVPTATPLAQIKTTVSLKTKRKQRSMLLSGAAVGCTSVKLTLPGKRSLTAAVRKGAWKTTVKYRTGRYTAVCGKATASRRAA